MIGFKRVFRWLGITAVVLLVVAAGLLLVLTVGRNRTPPIVDAQGGSLPGSVAELERRTIGGVEQTLLIRGKDAHNPVLLFLHGGPGMPAMYLAHAFQRPLENTFVVVQWDRRGAGKSFDARVPVDRLTVNQLIADTIEVTDYLRDRFRQRRILLVAHSWGTYVGLRVVAEHPERYIAYVGTGQMSDADPLATRNAQRTLVQAGARARELHDVDARITHGEVPTEDDLFASGGELRTASSFLPLIWIGVQAPEYSLADVMNVQKGAQLWMHRIHDEQPWQWFAAHTSFGVPIYFFVGRYDSNTPSSLASDYLDRIQAPDKGIVWFEQSAHFPFLEEPDHFASALLDMTARAQTALSP
jgi:pimeloyl-ACP methyl ester carboxylesterase